MSVGQGRSGERNGVTAGSRPAPRPRYRILTVSLYEHEATWVDRVTTMLRQAGNPKANRSLVVREAILRLEEVVGDKDPDALLRDFIDHHVRRGAKTSPDR